MRPYHICLMIAAACLASPAARAADTTAPRKPNFLFIYTDDQRWDAMGVVQREQGEKARFPWFKTPGMDRLAAEGVRFRNAFVTLSLCSPSRAAFLTGRYNHLNGIIDNGTPFPTSAVTHATLLRSAGYRTAYIGKWHMGNQRGQRPGFDYSASFIGQGQYNNCPFEINGEKTPTTGWVDDVSTAYAIDWMKQNRDRPFSMVVGFKSPHGPRGGRNLPDRLRDLYAGETSRRTPNCGVPPIFRAPVPPGGNQSQGLADNAIHLDYLRHVKGADENLGKLLEALDQLDLANDTVVVYSSDNGYYLGEHCLGDKRSVYEESLRVPMLVRYPRLFGKGRVVDEMVLNIDLAPTLLDLAGVPVPREMQGASWKALAAGQRPANWRKSFLAEYYKELGDTPTLVSVRTADSKIVTYPGHPEWTEVFDLTVDPYEIKNRVADEGARAKLNAELEAQKKAMEYTVPAKFRKPAAQAEKPAAPNLVVILVDDLGYGDIGSFGSKLNRTPQLDRMAREGMRLTSFYAAPVCTPSRAQMMTGCYAKRVSLPLVIFPSCPIGISSKEHTVAELLKERGYATMAIGKWHLGDQPAFLPTRHGFEQYFGLPYSNDMGGNARKTGDKRPPLPLLRDAKVIEAPAVQDTLTTRYTEEAVRFIRGNQHRPFFLYLAHTAVHVPLHPGAAFRGKSSNGTFGDWVEEVDWSVGQVLDTLRELKLSERTLVLFTSDNGPWMSQGRDGGVAGPLRGAKGTTWEGGVREPTIAWSPGRVAPGSSCDEPMSNVDVLPTFVGLAGGTVPGDHKIDGHDVWPLLSGKSRQSPHEALYYFNGNRLDAVRSGCWKLAIAPQGTGLPKGTAEPVKHTGPRLYNLESDIGEQKDVAAEHPEVVARLQKLVEQMDADLGVTGVGPGVRPPDRVEQPLPLVKRVEAEYD